MFIAPGPSLAWSRFGPRWNLPLTTAGMATGQTPLEVRDELGLAAGRHVNPLVEKTAAKVAKELKRMTGVDPWAG